MPDRLSTQYINSADYDDVVDKLKELKSNIDDQMNKTESSRKLRYAEVDIEAEREAGRLAPDELYVPLHIIDTNVRREQSSYVQYITQSARAIICKNKQDPAFDMQDVELDLTEKLRYEGWQLSQFSNIDGFESHGYSVIEVVLDLNNPGHIGYEFVQYPDFGFISDTRDLQAVEFTMRAYYFTRSRLLALCGDGTKEDDWDREQVEKIISREPEGRQSIESSDAKDKSLYKVYKTMYRIDGVVNVAWCDPQYADGWLRAPRPLFIGRVKAVEQQSMIGRMANTLLMRGPQQPSAEPQFETNYPYIVFPYLISENDTIAELKGRVFLDQDLQEAASSLMSSIITKARRSAGLYFSKDVSDPNDDILMQKNIFLRQGALINAKVNAFQLEAPDPGLFSSINLLMAANQNETSQVNFATNNRKDSRKTAEEVRTSSQQQQILSTVQVVLYDISLAQMYRIGVSIIKSRVLAGLIQVNDILKQKYAIDFSVKPAGGVDVIERQKTLQQMMMSWPVVQGTAIAEIFLLDMLELMFPDRVAKYKQQMEVAKQQQQSQQNQMMQALVMVAKQLADGIHQLAHQPEMFSESGKIYALPGVKQADHMLKQIEESFGQSPQNNGKSKPRIAQTSV